MAHIPSNTPPLIDYSPPLDPYLVVVYEDEHIVVLDKQAGLLSVPGKDEAHRDCIEARAQARLGDARIVHRLDMDTSGLMVLARDGISHKGLGRQFEKRKVKKSYLAKVWGQLNPDEGTVELPLICDWPNRPKQMVSFEHGKPAHTDWKVLTREADRTLVRLTPHTGRSHQLRVHMLSLGHVIIGDRFYAQGDALIAADRLLLHAERLAFIHPVKSEWMEFESACPFA